MAIMKKRWGWVEKLAQVAREEGYEGESDGAVSEAYVFDRISAGDSTYSIHRDERLKWVMVEGEEVEVKDPERLFYWWLHDETQRGLKDGAAGRWERYKAAQKRGQTARIDGVDELLDGIGEQAHVTSTDVSLAREKVRSRQWVAGRLARDRFGDAGSGNVTVNVGELHLDALRSLGGASALPREEPVKEIPAEVVDDDE